MVTTVVGIAVVTGVVFSPALAELTIVLAEHTDVVSPAAFVAAEHSVVVIVVGMALVAGVTGALGAKVVT